jgi:hypothetical protein
VRGKTEFGTIGVNGMTGSKTPFVFNVGSDSIEVEKFRIRITDREGHEWSEFLEIPLFSKVMPEFGDIEIADGRVVTVVKEGVNEETAFLGTGNGDGIPNPGESVVVLVRDMDKLRRTNLTCLSPFINPYGINERVSDLWSVFDHVGGSAKYSVPLIASGCPDNQEITFVAEYWLPDYPDHIIKKGLVRIKVSGKDNTPPVLKWCRVTGDNVIQAGMLDGSPVKEVKARLVNKANPEKYIEYVLKDDGRDGDRAEGDNVFSFRVPEQRFGLYTIDIVSSDSGNNAMSARAKGWFVLH